MKFDSAFAVQTMTPETDHYQTEEARWRAVIARDSGAEGVFYYSVSTTGVYCRPGCGSRRPLREHVHFHNSWQHAESAGFRPCKRCRPDEKGETDRPAQIIEDACRWIESAEESPTLAELADRAGYSAYHFHRLFKRYTGVTPKAYGQAYRTEKIKYRLRERGAVTDAIYDAGYGASSRFYEESQKRLGMTPTQFKQGGAGQQIRYAVAECGLGLLLVAATEKGVCLIHFGDDRERLQAELANHFPRAVFADGDKRFNHWVAEVLERIERGGLPNRDLPLDIRGTAFQQRVWQALREIPSGKTATYREVAQMIGQPKAARAVARACASNILAVAVPCHRVIRSDGSLSGYRWGVERKQKLLENEAKH